jgi:hypothetical protein
MVDGKEQRVRGYGGRYSGRRVNCEDVPVLPADNVRLVLDDPRKVPYLFVWTSPSDVEPREAVRVAPYREPPNRFNIDWTGWVEIKDTEGRYTRVKTIWRAMPRNGGTYLLLVCPGCFRPRRALYGWAHGGKWSGCSVKGRWQCRESAELRYASEGGALRPRGRGRMWRLFHSLSGRMPAIRPQPWYPYVFSDPVDAGRLVGRQGQ